jgi:hypothetical protein
LIALEISQPRWFNPAGFFVGVQALACPRDTLKRVHQTDAELWVSSLKRELQRGVIFSSAFLRPSVKRKAI